MTEPTPDRPLVTFALFAYNQEKFIREAVEGAFAQTYEPLEIILSDDCSSDRTFEIMQEMAAAYDGPHEVRVRKNATNSGIGSHVSAVLSESRGNYIVFAAGDDISESDRTKYVISLINEFDTKCFDACRLSFLSSLTLVDEEGVKFGATKAPKGKQEITRKDGSESVGVFNMRDLLNGSFFTSGPSRVIHRGVYEIFGEIGEDCFTEDIVFLFRGALIGPTLFSSKKTVRYRKHRSNLSTPKNLYTKSFKGVERQLRDDLNTALKGNYISKQEGERAKKWIDAHVAFRSFYKAKANDERPRFSDLFRLLVASHLSVRRKFGIFREFIGIR